MVCRDLMKVGLHVLKRKKVHKNHFFQLPFFKTRVSSYVLVKIHIGFRHMGLRLPHDLGHG